MMCENAVNARVPVAVPGARGSSPLLKKVAGAVAATAALGAATAAYGHFVELNNFQLRTESLPVLPAGSPDFRILHISDMHMIPGQRKKTEFMHSLAALEPDLVMNTGDNLSHVGGMEPLLEALDPLMDFPGVFGVLEEAGNASPFSIEIEFTQAGPKNLAEIDQAVQDSADYLRAHGFEL